MVDDGRYVLIKVENVPEVKNQNGPHTIVGKPLTEFIPNDETDVPRVLRFLKKVR